MIDLKILFILFCFPAFGVWSRSSFYDPEECGKGFVETSETTQKIMGGRDAKAGQFPAAVSIFRNGYYVCGGTLISKKHVTTAAHCFWNTQKPTLLQKMCNNDTACIKETLGRLNITMATETCKGYPLTPSEIKSSTKVYSDFSGCLHGESCKNRISQEQEFGVVDIHQSYVEFFHRGCHSDDLAILTLDKEIDLKTASYMCIPDFNILSSQKKDATAFVIGWGSDAIENKANHEILQVLQVGAILSRAACHELWGPPRDRVCVSELVDKDTCAGDSGGALLVEREKKLFLVGCLSYGTGCEDLRKGKRPKAMAYTRIDFHLREISQALHWEAENNLDINFET